MFVLNVILGIEEAKSQGAKYRLGPELEITLVIKLYNYKIFCF